MTTCNCRYCVFLRFFDGVQRRPKLAKNGEISSLPSLPNAFALSVGFFFPTRHSNCSPRTGRAFGAGRGGLKNVAGKRSQLALMWAILATAISLPVNFFTLEMAAGGLPAMVGVVIVVTTVAGVIHRDARVSLLSFVFTVV